MKLKEFTEKVFPLMELYNSTPVTQPLSDIIMSERVVFGAGILIGVEFAEWATHNDWVYLPSKQKWYNEEDEENITPLTTTELLEIFLTEKMK